MDGLPEEYLDLGFTSILRPEYCCFRSIQQWYWSELFVKDDFTIFEQTHYEVTMFLVSSYGCSSRLLVESLYEHV